MNLERQTQRLKHNGEALLHLATGFSDEQARWKPAPDAWSILEVVNHLYDEEREDFRPRLDIMLHRPEESMSKIDPVGWAIERSYNERDLKESVKRFRVERKRSLRWLERLREPDWDAVYEMAWGPMTAGDMFASWIVHDLLHMRQIVRLRWSYAKLELEPYQVSYAGSW